MQIYCLQLIRQSVSQLYRQSPDCLVCGRGALPGPCPVQSDVQTFFSPSRLEWQTVRCTARDDSGVTGSISDRVACYEARAANNQGLGDFPAVLTNLIRETMRYFHTYTALLRVPSRSLVEGYKDCNCLNTNQTAFYTAFTSPGS